MIAMSLRDAAYHVVHDYPGGASSLAPRLGKSSTYLSSEVAGTGTAKLGLLDAETITYLTGDLRILSAFATNAGQMLVPLPLAGDLPNDDCMLRLADSAKGFGDLCKEVASDLADGNITDNELTRIDRECGALIAKLHALRGSLAKRNLAGKAAYLNRAEQGA
ncbi:phage regulatory CII family protein [Rhodoferax ferrireducens]|uniref:phage regulatory CII family protein n=1 Tax=Rhodoferax ferrireducens TaxID=192843 RepID=UPI0013009DEF|nr:phage regulatory CII family protein [Rhodoferax ferrireducens]